MVAADRNIRHQQDLAGRQRAPGVLATTHWVTIRENAADILAAIEAAGRSRMTREQFFDWDHAAVPSILRHVILE